MLGLPGRIEVCTLETVLENIITSRQHRYTEKLKRKTDYDDRRRIFTNKTLVRGYLEDNYLVRDRMSHKGSLGGILHFKHPRQFNCRHTTRDNKRQKVLLYGLISLTNDGIRVTYTLCVVQTYEYPY